MEGEPFRRLGTGWVMGPRNRPAVPLTGTGGIYELGEDRGLMGKAVWALE